MLLQVVLARKHLAASRDRTRESWQARRGNQFFCGRTRRQQTPEERPLTLLATMNRLVVPAQVLAPLERGGAVLRRASMHRRAAFARTPPRARSRRPPLARRHNLHQRRPARWGAFPAHVSLVRLVVHLGLVRLPRLVHLLDRFRQKLLPFRRALGFLLLQLALHLLLQILDRFRPPTAHDRILLERDRRVLDQRRLEEVVLSRVRMDARCRIARERVTRQVGRGRERGRELVRRDVRDVDEAAGRDRRRFARRFRAVSFTRRFRGWGVAIPCPSVGSIKSSLHSSKDSPFSSVCGDCPPSLMLSCPATALPSSCCCCS